MRAYASALQMPARYLPLFNFAERASPWGPRPGYRSLFQILKEQQFDSFVCAWPESQTRPPYDDGALVQETLNGFNGNHRFGFLHLSALDGLGHAYGPGSPEVHGALQHTDRLVERLLAHLDATFDEYALVVIADHGMVRVLDRVDALTILESSGLRLGTDAAWFVDSTTVRAWVLNERARPRLIETLATIPGGRLLDAADCARFELTGAARANGEYFVLADPGVVFSPNFYQGGPEVPCGMHGYAPDVPDNQGLFLLYDSHRRDRGDAGVVEARQLFATLLDRCGLPVPEAHRQFIASPRPASPHRVRFTADPAADRAVRAQLARTAARITEQDTSYEAIAIGGSFGRGEGVTRETPGGTAPLNDYDLMVIGGTTPSSVWREIGEALAEQFQTDFVDIGIWNRDLDNLPRSQETFDWRYGSQVLRGDPLTLTRLPDLAPADVPIGDAIRLLGNRTCGVLLAETRVGDAAFAQSQLIKLVVGLLDACVISWRDYHSAIAVKRRRAAALWRAAGLRETTAAVLDAGARIKLGGRADRPEVLRFECVQRALRDVLNYLASSATPLDDVAMVRRCMERRADRDHPAAALHEAALLLCLAGPHADAADPRIAAAIERLHPTPDGVDRQALASLIVERWLPTIH